MGFLWLRHELLRQRASKAGARTPLSVDGGRDAQLLHMERNPSSVSCKSTLDLQTPLQGPLAEGAGGCGAVPRTLPAALTLPCRERRAEAEGLEGRRRWRRRQQRSLLQRNALPGMCRAWHGPACVSSSPATLPTARGESATSQTCAGCCASVASRSRCCPQVLLSLCPPSAGMEEPQGSLLQGTSRGSRGTCLPRPLAVPCGRARAGPGTGRHHYSGADNEFGIRAAPCSPRRSPRPPWAGGVPAAPGALGVGSNPH